MGYAILLWHSMVLPYNYFLSSGFPTRFDTNRARKPQKMDRGLKIQIQEVEGLYYLCNDTICAIVFAYPKRRFSKNAAQSVIANQYDNEM